MPKLLSLEIHSLEKLHGEGVPRCDSNSWINFDILGTF